MEKDAAGCRALNRNYYCRSVGTVHYEPMGLYPGKTASLDELKK